MGARHLGLSHAARRRGLPSGGLAGDPLPGRLQDRPRNRLAPQFQPARRPERRNSRGQRMGGPLRLSADGMDARTVSCAGNSAASELTLKHLERAQRRKDAPHNEERHPAPIDQRIHCNPPEVPRPARGVSSSNTALWAICLLHRFPPRDHRRRARIRASPGASETRIACTVPCDVPPLFTAVSAISSTVQVWSVPVLE